MEPPLKRPRLSMFPKDLPPDETLSQARWRNDLSLKSRFEAIFEKYAHDFTGIGDEIEVATGTVVVNNGHLEAMEDERDAGTAMPPSRTPPSRPGNINGGSLLRAMTAAPEDHSLSFEDVHDDDLVMSIEVMAENAAVYSDDDDDGDDIETGTVDDSTDSDYDWGLQVVPASPVASTYENLEEGDSPSDEELFQMSDKISAEQSYRGTATFSGIQDTVFPEDWVCNPERGEQSSLINDIDSHIVIKQENDDCWPDRGSLFGGRDEDRSSSPDSLFEAERYLSGFKNHALELEGQDPAYPELPSIGREVSDDAILDKFGPKIGPQVIDVLQKRRAMMDAHIEPAWRVPDIGVVFPKPKFETPPDDLRLSPEPSSGKKDSLWRDSQASRPALQGMPYKISRKVRGSSQWSNESEDPLQEDFQQAKSVDNVPDNENFGVSLEDIHDGTCPFCRKQFSVRGSVYVHWDELIKKSVRDDVHDMAYIIHQRRRKRRRSQFPKVTVQDFYAMVKLREVDRLDWQEISDQGLFGQRPATSLQSIYYQYRTLAKTDEELAAERRSWTAEEDDRLLDFCEDPTMTFQKLRKLMRTRPQAELGNRLASIWMQEYAGEYTEHGYPQIKANISFKTARCRLPSSPEPGQARCNSLKSDLFRRSWSSDSMDSLFQVDFDAGGNGEHSDSDDGLFDAVQHRDRSPLPGK
jgi:hypothetical protein